MFLNYFRRLLNKAKVKISLYLTNWILHHKNTQGTGEQHLATKRSFALSPLCLKEIPMSTHGVGGWMVPRWGSDIWRRGKYSAPARNLISFLGRPDRRVRQMGSLKTEVNKYIISVICLQNTALAYRINFAETFGALTNAGNINVQQ
jgi:hypothetical protein